MITVSKKNALHRVTPLRILAVENHPDTREVLTLMLESLGHTVVVAESMRTALTKAVCFNCDVLLSDIDLPDGSGWELLSRLDLPRPMYAIAMSGYGTTSDHKRSKAAGFRHHLVKPMGLEQLETILAEAAKELRGSTQKRSQYAAGFRARPA